MVWASLLPWLLLGLTFLSSAQTSWLRVPSWASKEPYLPSGAADLDYYSRMQRRSPDYKVYHNAWWQAFRFFAWLPPQEMCQLEDVSSVAYSTDPDEGQRRTGRARLEDGVATNSNIVRAPVADIQALTSNLRTAYLPGNTLLIDFPFLSFTNHLGHWAELMVPIFSILQDGSWRGDVRGLAVVGPDGDLAVEGGGGGAPGAGGAATGVSQHINTVLMVNKVRHMASWFSSLLEITLAAAFPQGPRPRVVDYTDLAGFDQSSWLMIENLVVVQDRWVWAMRRSSMKACVHICPGTMTMSVLASCPTLASASRLWKGSAIHPHHCTCAHCPNCLCLPA